MGKNLSKHFEAETPVVWILDVPQFQSWLESPESNFLLLSGPTGFGKSVLAASLIDELETSTDACVAFFFCKDLDKMYKPCDIIRALAYQLATHSEDVRKELKQVWKSDKKTVKFHRPLQNIFQALLEKPLRSFAQSQRLVYFVLDGFNECPSSEMGDISKLIRLLRHLDTVKIVVTCQPVYELRQAFTGAYEISLEGCHNWSAVESYVTTKLAEYGELRDRCRALDVDIYEHVEQNYNGMFLWVTLILEELDRTATDQELMEVLSTGSGDINAIYTRKMERIEALDAGNKLWIQQLFNWLVLSRRQLTLEELEEGISISRQIVIGQTEMARPINFKELLTHCGAFLQIQSYYKIRDNPKAVTLVHDSLKLFLLQRGNVSNIFSVDQYSVNDLLASACLQSLSCLSMGQSISPLFTYSSLYFSSHLMVSHPSACTLGRLRSFLAAPCFRAWVGEAAKHAENAELLGPLALRLDLAKPIATMLNCLEKWRSSNVIVFPASDDESAVSLSATVGILAKAWLTSKPSDNNFLVVDFYDILKSLYFEFVETGSHFGGMASVVEVGAWAGYKNFQMNTLWNYNVGRAWNFEGNTERACHHFHKAAQSCEDNVERQYIFRNWVSVVRFSGHQMDVFEFGDQTRGFVQSILQYFEEVVAKEDSERPLDPPSGLSKLYFARFLGAGESTDLDKAIELELIEQSGPTISPFDIEIPYLGIFFQAKWGCTGMDEDFSASVQLFERHLKILAAIKKRDWILSDFRIGLLPLLYERGGAELLMARQIERLKTLGEQHSSLLVLLQLILARLNLKHGDLTSTALNFDAALFSDTVNTDIVDTCQLQHRHHRCYKCYQHPMHGYRHICIKCQEACVNLDCSICEKCFSRVSGGDDLSDHKGACEYLCIPRALPSSCS